MPNSVRNFNRDETWPINENQIDRAESYAWAVMSAGGGTRSLGNPPSDLGSSWAALVLLTK